MGPRLTVYAGRCINIQCRRRLSTPRDGRAPWRPCRRGWILCLPRPEEPMNRRELCRVVAAAVAGPALTRLSGDELWAGGRRGGARATRPIHSFARRPGGRGRAGPRRVGRGLPERLRGAARSDPYRARRRGTGGSQGEGRRQAALLRPHEVRHGVRLLHVRSGSHGRAALRGDPGRVRAMRPNGPLARGAGGLLMAAPSFDAIVVGSGLTGGWAAKELCERGLKTLVLEAGRPIDPARDYVEHVPPWEMK